MKIGILGAGKIGCFVTAMIAENTEHEIHLLARSNYKTIKTSGITITETESAKTNTFFPFGVYQDIRELPPCDLVIIATHVSQNRDLLKEDLPLFSPTTKIVTLQNGLDFEEDLSSLLPLNLPLYSGTSWIKVTQLRSQHFRHDFGNNIKLGRYNSTELPTSISDEDNEIKSFFNHAGFTLDLTDNIHAVQITKLALNIPFLITIAKYGKSPTEILLDPSLDALRVTFQNEIITASKSIGLSIDSDLINHIIEDLKKMPIITPSCRKTLAENTKKDLPQYIEPLIRFMHLQKQTLPVIEKEYLSLQ